MFRIGINKQRSPVDSGIFVSVGPEMGRLAKRQGTVQHSTKGPFYSQKSLSMFPRQRPSSPFFLLVSSPAHLLNFFFLRFYFSSLLAFPSCYYCHFASFSSLSFRNSISVINKLQSFLTRRRSEFLKVDCSQEIISIAYFLVINLVILYNLPQ